MQSLMSNLLASAAGKQEFTPFATSASNYTSDSFIIPGEYRQEHCSPDDAGTPTREARFYYPSGNNYPSYVPCYDISGYSSSPTYVRGDFYSLSPPESPEVNITRAGSVEPVRPESKLPFSIDVILGSENSSEVQKVDSPACVYSDVTASRTPCSSGQFRFSMSDWSTLQNTTRHTVPQSERKVYWCHVCDITCSTTEVAASHQTEHSTKGDSCKLQRAHFQKHGYVTAHEETDYLNRIKCGLCDKIVTKAFFGKHLRRHDGHVCDVCGHESPSNSQLLTHMRNHGAEVRVYTCKICDRKFGDKDRLATHEISHGKSGHQCKSCGKTFCSKYARLVHERSHTGSKPFVCKFPGCNRSFPQKVQLRLHVNTRH